MESCQSMGSDLAQPTNDLESNTLTNVLAASSTDPNDSFWIGKTVSPSFVHFWLHREIHTSSQNSCFHIIYL
jgi:hypothetical protein